jgi:hypothetical protein
MLAMCAWAMRLHSPVWPLAFALLCLWPGTATTLHLAAFAQHAPSTPRWLLWRHCRRHVITAVAPAPVVSDHTGAERSWSQVSPSVVARAVAAARASSGAIGARGPWATFGHDALCVGAWAGICVCGVVGTTLGLPLLFPLLTRRAVDRPLWEHACRLFVIVSFPAHAMGLVLQVRLCESFLRRPPVRRVLVLGSPLY